MAENPTTNEQRPLKMWLPYHGVRVKEWRLGLRDRVACHVGIWALRRLYGADCGPDTAEGCISCDAKRMVENMQEILQDA